jgi:hypothetical protein
MPKGKGKRKRTSRFRKYLRRRTKDKRIPLSIGLGLATSVLVPAKQGWASALDAAKSGDFKGAIDGFVANWTGFGPIMKPEYAPTIDFGALINPFDFSCAPALKTTILSSIMFRLVKKIAHTDPISKVPIVKNYVKFS